MRLVAIVLLCMCAASVTGVTLAVLYGHPDLYRPSPGGREAGHEPEAHAAKPDQQAGDQTSGTEENPFVVKVAPSPEAQPETPEQRQERQTRTTEDWWAVVFAGIAAFATVFLVFVTGGLWLYTYRLWGGTRDALKLATDDFAATHRPWIPPKVRPASKLIISENGVSLTIEIVLENTGNSPAFRVWPEAAMLIHEEVDGQIIRQAEIEKKALATSGRAIRGYTIFPGQKVEIRRLLTVSAEDYEKIAPRARENGILFYVVGCIPYRAAFSGRFNKTGFSYGVIRATTPGRVDNGTTFPPIYHAYAPEHLIFRADPMAADQTD